MCIYCNTNNYRRIYEEHNGPIPVDDENRTYEIHHKDGNHSNNSPENLIAVSLQEHFDIHYKQEDWAACQLISLRLNISPEKRSKISSLTQQERVKNGSHPWLKGANKDHWAPRIIKPKESKTMTRHLCKKCGQNPAAVNYYKSGKVYYRSQCDHCARGHKESRPPWLLSGYKKKNSCDRCGFRSSHQEVFNVFHVDGNLTNCRHSNLKTVCANCQRVLHKEGIKWKQGGLTADF